MGKELVEEQKMMMAIPYVQSFPEAHRNLRCQVLVRKFTSF